MQTVTLRPVAHDTIVAFINACGINPASVQGFTADLDRITFHCIDVDATGDEIRKYDVVLNIGPTLEGTP